MTKKDVASKKKLKNIVRVRLVSNQQLSLDKRVNLTTRPLHQACSIISIKLNCYVQKHRFLICSSLLSVYLAKTIEIYRLLSKLN